MHRFIVLLAFTAVCAVTSHIAAETYYATIPQTSDDGTEANESVWYEDGFISAVNFLGQGSDSKRYSAGLRFRLNDAFEGDEFVFARLRFTSSGSYMTSSVKLLIEGILQESPATFSDDDRPSQKLPKTSTKLEWEIGEQWFSGQQMTGKNSIPILYSSPDISSILNEILALPGWGSGFDGKTLVITISEYGSSAGETNIVGFQDYLDGGVLRSPVTLEVYKTIADTFDGKQFLGRITDTSATLSLHSLIATDIQVVYGTSPDVFTDTSQVYFNQPAREALEIDLEDLLPDTRYYYRVRSRKAGRGVFVSQMEADFHTQRAVGEPFVFCVQADEHLSRMYVLPTDTARMDLYKQTILNMSADNPDLLISLGDFGISGDGFSSHFDPGDDYRIFYEEGKERYLRQRQYLGTIAKSSSFYLVIGNHEGEQAWLYNGDSTSSALQLAKARKEVIPNPFPDEFYSGNDDIVPGLGLREDYYAWEWGDALFVVIDPFSYTTTKPHNWHGPGSLDGWDWTLGKEQYDWLYETLHNSDAVWKFVFTHHLTSTTVPVYYGRGGIEVAKYKVDGNPSFEWGGENKFGNYVFDLKRPGWNHGAIHDMLAAEGVTMVFHGHDHFFAAQTLDGIVYQECPVPGDPDYSMGFAETGGYKFGRLMPNSGHVRVTVDPLLVQVDYIRSYLPGDGDNGEIGYHYVIPRQNRHKDRSP